MIVRQFLLWARHASVGQRADATSALARAYLHSDLSPEVRWEAETALTTLLDDAPPVRRAIAEAFADAVEAPRHLVTALANDLTEIAVVILARSPVLAEADLIDCAALGEEPVRLAIAIRPWVPIPVAAAVAEIGSAAVLVRLLANPGADISDWTFARIVERHGAVPQVRDALLGRSDLPVAVRQGLATSVADSWSEFAVGCGWLSRERSERVTRDAREKATLALSAAADRSDVGRLVSHLRQTGQLTPAFLLRAVLSRRLALVENALADLTDLPLNLVAGMIHDRTGSGFAALCRRAGLPEIIRPPFEAALSVWRETVREGVPAEGAWMSRRMVERALGACDRLPPEEAGRIIVMLRRFEAEAAREEAREYADALAREAGLPAPMLQPYRRDRLAEAA